MLLCRGGFAVTSGDNTLLTLHSVTWLPFRPSESHDSDFVEKMFDRGLAVDRRYVGISCAIYI